MEALGQYIRLLIRIRDDLPVAVMHDAPHAFDFTDTGDQNGIKAEFCPPGQTEQIVNAAELRLQSFYGAAALEAARDGTAVILHPLLLAARDEARRYLSVAIDTADVGGTLVMSTTVPLNGAINELYTFYKADLPPKPPVWDPDTAKLTIDGQLAKKIKNIRQAKNLVCILCAFQESGWPARIDDPLPGIKGTNAEQKRRDRLGEALRSMNDNLIGMQFERDGGTEGIRWERTRTLP